MKRKARIRQYFEEQGGLCVYCFQKMTLKLNKPNTAQIEHIIPKAHKRVTGHFNEVAACSTCNREKSDKPLRTFLSGLAQQNRRDLC
jgi:5-methylcytosine-specific restriction endonuclease McrA